MEKETNKVMKKLRKYYGKTQPTVRRTSENNSPFKVLISCLISLRTRDETTEKITKELFDRVENPKDIIRMSQKELEDIIYSSGYYKNKTKILKHVSKEILDKYGGKVPSNKKELISIKGIGPKTANIVLSFAFNKKVIPVDTNVHRIANRLGWVNTGKFKFEETEKALEKILDKKWWKEINTLFILHGRKICVPQSPKCSECIISENCPKKGVGKRR